MNAPLLQPLADALSQAIDEVKRLTLENASLRTMARFGLEVFEAHRNDGHPGDLDGAYLHDVAVEMGVLEPFESAGPCGETCVCAEVDPGPGEPYDCYRASEAVIASRSIFRGDSE